MTIPSIYPEPGEVSCDIAMEVNGEHGISLHLLGLCSLAQVKRMEYGAINLMFHGNYN